MIGNNTKIIVPIESLYETASNLQRYIVALNSDAANGMPYLNGLRQKLLNNGTAAKAESIRKDYLIILAATERLLAPMVRNRRI